MAYVAFDIIAVAKRCGIKFHTPSLGRTEVQAVCPFCGDKRHHLGLNTTKNQFYCHRCGIGGNAVTLYAKVFGIDNKAAFAALSDDRLLKLPVNRAILPISAIAPKPLQERHNVYYSFLNMLALTDNHRNNLRNRGLNDNVIEAFMYKSVPLDGQFRRCVLNELSATYDLLGIPGFFTDDNGAWRMYLPKDGGTFISVVSADGFIQGMQIRLDNTENRKYRWFSSNHYSNGTKGYPWIHTAGDVASATACITEGALKADVASVLSGGRLFVGIPGVNCISGLPDVLKGLKIKRVIETYDMDKRDNPQVAKALESLKRLLKGLRIAYVPYAWNPQYNGIDEYLYHQQAG
jgi:hypothetical protein